MNVIFLSIRYKVTLSIRLIRKAENLICEYANMKVGKGDKMKWLQLRKPLLYIQ